MKKWLLHGHGWCSLSLEAQQLQVYDLEQNGGSIIGGVIKLLQGRKKNPPPPRDQSLPPKPPGQTVGSFRNGLQSLPQAIAKNLEGKIRYAQEQPLYAGFVLIPACPGSPAICSGFVAYGLSKLT